MRRFVLLIVVSMLVAAGIQYGVEKAVEHELLSHATVALLASVVLVANGYRVLPARFVTERAAILVPCTISLYMASHLSQLEGPLFYTGFGLALVQLALYIYATSGLSGATMAASMFKPMRQVAA